MPPHSLAGAAVNAFACIRPPGHHCHEKFAFGFCYCNNVAIAARYAQKQYGVKRIAIVDWDIHAGDGTQNIFIDDPSVLVVSIHRGDAFFPGSATEPNRYQASVTGDGEGAGRTVNIAWPGPGHGDQEYAAAFQYAVIPILADFQPELILVSSGFDAAQGDTLGECHVSPHMYGCMTSILGCLDPPRGLVLFLEGGYTLDAIGPDSLHCVKALVDLAATSRRRAASVSSLPLSPGGGQRMATYENNDETAAPAHHRAPPALAADDADARGPQLQPARDAGADADADADPVSLQDMYDMSIQELTRSSSAANSNSSGNSSGSPRGGPAATPPPSKVLTVLPPSIRRPGLPLACRPSLSIQPGAVCALQDVMHHLAPHWPSVSALQSTATVAGHAPNNAPIVTFNAPLSALHVRVECLVNPEDKRPYGRDYSHIETRGNGHSVELSTGTRTRRQIAAAASSSSSSSAEDGDNGDGTGPVRPLQSPEVKAGRADWRLHKGWKSLHLAQGHGPGYSGSIAGVGATISVEVEKPDASTSAGSTASGGSGLPRVFFRVRDASGRRTVDLEVTGQVPPTPVAARRGKNEVAGTASDAQNAEQSTGVPKGFKSLVRYYVNDRGTGSATNETATGEMSFCEADPGVIDGGARTRVVFIRTTGTGSADGRGEGDGHSVAFRNRHVAAASTAAVASSTASPTTVIDAGTVAPEWKHQWMAWARAYDQQQLEGATYQQAGARGDEPGAHQPAAAALPPVPDMCSDTSLPIHGVALSFGTQKAITDTLKALNTALAQSSALAHLQATTVAQAASIVAQAQVVAAAAQAVLNSNATATASVPAPAASAAARAPTAVVAPPSPFAVPVPSTASTVAATDEASATRTTAVTAVSRTDAEGATPLPSSSATAQTTETATVAPDGVDALTASVNAMSIGDGATPAPAAPVAVPVNAAVVAIAGPSTEAAVAAPASSPVLSSSTTVDGTEPAPPAAAAPAPKARIKLVFKQRPLPEQALVGVPAPASAAAAPTAEPSSAAAPSAPVVSAAAANPSASASSQGSPEHTQKHHPAQQVVASSDDTVSAAAADGVAALTTSMASMSVMGRVAGVPLDAIMMRSVVLSAADAAAQSSAVTSASSFNLQPQTTHPAAAAAAALPRSIIQRHRTSTISSLSSTVDSQVDGDTDTDDDKAAVHDEAGTQGSTERSRTPDAAATPPTTLLEATSDLAPASGVVDVISNIVGVSAGPDAASDGMKPPAPEATHRDGPMSAPDAVAALDAVSDSEPATPAVVASQLEAVAASQSQVAPVAAGPQVPSRRPSTVVSSSSRSLKSAGVGPTSALGGQHNALVPGHAPIASRSRTGSNASVASSVASGVTASTVGRQEADRADVDDDDANGFGALQVSSNTSTKVYALVSQEAVRPPVFTGSARLALFALPPSAFPAATAATSPSMWPHSPRHSSVDETRLLSAAVRLGCSDSEVFVLDLPTKLPAWSIGAQVSMKVHDHSGDGQGSYAGSGSVQVELLASLTSPTPGPNAEGSAGAVTNSAVRQTLPTHPYALVLAAGDQDERQIASITKVMTTIVVLGIVDAVNAALADGKLAQHDLIASLPTMIASSGLPPAQQQQSSNGPWQGLHTHIRVSQRASGMKGTSAKLQHGEIYTLLDLLHGMMLPSGNDAATALAECFGCMCAPVPAEQWLPHARAPHYDSAWDRNDPLSRFTAEMNRAASQLKMNSTVFANPHGLVHPSHKSCARDVARLVSSAMSDPRIRAIVGCSKYECLAITVKPQQVAGSDALAAVVAATVPAHSSGDGADGAGATPSTTLETAPASSSSAMPAAMASPGAAIAPLSPQPLLPPTSSSSPSKIEAARLAAQAKIEQAKQERVAQLMAKKPKQQPVLTAGVAPKPPTATVAPTAGAAARRGLKGRSSTGAAIDTGFTMRKVKWANTNTALGDAVDRTASNAASLTAGVGPSSVTGAASAPANAGGSSSSSNGYTICGVKTGITPVAGACLALAAWSDGMHQAVTSADKGSVSATAAGAASASASPASATSASSIIPAFITITLGSRNKTLRFIDNTRLMQYASHVIDAVASST